MVQAQRRNEVKFGASPCSCSTSECSFDSRAGVVRACFCAIVSRIRQNARSKPDAGGLPVQPQPAGDRFVTGRALPGEDLAHQLVLPRCQAKASAAESSTAHSHDCKRAAPCGTALSDGSSAGRRSYLMIFDTTPAPTVRPPSRMAKRSFSSIAIGAISSTLNFRLSPGITISVPSGS